MSIPQDYAERVYAGVLGKIIGVYVGKPFEGWTYERIMAELGEIWTYVHERRARPLIVTDDDIAGTFTFLRALPDYGNSPDVTPAQIGQTWLNYAIEGRTILSWAGYGNSTEHTAYLQLGRGVQPPLSGSIALNGKIVSEQIGAQIFIDGWAMVAPGDPGLAGLEAGPDWRGPVADRLYLPTADGGRAITDAVTETYHIVNVGRALAGKVPVVPKDGARFHFELLGAVQGFAADDDGADGYPLGTRGMVKVENVGGHSSRGTRSLAIRYHHLARGWAARVATPTFIPQDAIPLTEDRIRPLLASPTMYPGQTIRAQVVADRGNSLLVDCRPYLRSYGASDELGTTYGPEAALEPGSSYEFEWRVDAIHGGPIAAIGIELCSSQRADGTVYLDYLTWDGVPDVVLTRPDHGGVMWQKAWVDGVDQMKWNREPYRLVQNRGTGLLIQGTREWADYRVCADVTPHLAKAAGIAARVQGMRRYYGLLLCRDGKVRLVKALDGDRVLADADLPWDLYRTYDLGLEVEGYRLRAWVDGTLYFDVLDTGRPLMSGGVALICEEGCTATHVVRVGPVGRAEPGQRPDLSSQDKELVKYG